MYSVNAPVPPEVSRLARGLAAELIDATPRDRHTLVIKRLGEGDPQTLTHQVRDAIVGTEPFQVRITGTDVFQNPITGHEPVVYLRVESPELLSLHRRLCERFGAIEQLEGDDYSPHVTIARGGDADSLVGRDVDLEWTIDSLFVWAARYDEPAERISLPA
ncbi:MAG: 2'-5' RNA ligase [Natronomonas sp.]|uniref:2'-5' RNA ligase family protein n=1 Tax=Natronomonas sp. TaxID=2184060 RepID=UPI00398969D8